MTATVVEQIPIVQVVCRRRLGRLTRPLVDPQDVAQDALVGLLRAERDHPGMTVTTGLAVTVAWRRCVDAQRAARHEPIRVPLDELLVHPPAREPGPAELALRAELRRRLRSLLAETLTDRERTVIYLRVWAGLSTMETAAVLGTSPGAVRVTQHRALARLRARLVGGAA